MEFFVTATKIYIEIELIYDFNNCTSEGDKSNTIISNSLSIYTNAPRCVIVFDPLGFL